MKRLTTLNLPGALLLALLLVGFSTAQADMHELSSAGAQYVTSDVYHFDPFPEMGNAVPGAKVWLVASDTSLTTIVETSELPPGDAVTLWWVIFNNPLACAAHPEPCDMDDLMGNTEAVGAEVTYAAGTVIDDEGKGTFVGHHAGGETAQDWFGNGLSNPTGAEVHLVLRTHGPVIEDRADEMIGTFRGGCYNVEEDHPAYGDGETGPNECEDLQFAVLQQH